MLKKSSLDKIRRISLNVRRRILKLSYKYTLSNNNLGGLCGLSSYFLSQELLKYFKSTKYCYGFFYRSRTNYCGHAWIEVDDYIVDITATQFEKVPTTVLILRKENANKYKKLVDGKRGLDQLRDWSDWQNPFKWKKQYKKIVGIK